MRIMIVGIGGFAGAVARYLIDGWVMTPARAAFPLGTLIINLSGSFVLGFFYALTLDRFIINPQWRLFVAVGFLGAYTTFSTLSYETVKMIENGSLSAASFNIAANIIGGLIAVYLGVVLARVF